MNASSTILIIDNDERLVKALVVQLSRCGYTCLAAYSGAQGIAMFQSHDVDLVITDVNMPDGNGVEITRSIRALGDAPVIVITGFRDHYQRDLRALANVSVIRKPFTFSQLHDVVEAELVLNDHSK
jgi:DNA-binding response OmpR family regulator